MKAVVCLSLFVVFTVRFLISITVDVAFAVYFFVGDEEVLDLAKGHDEVLKVLRALGHIFRTIVFAPVPSSGEETDEIAEHLNRYCGQAEQHVIIAIAHNMIPSEVVPIEHATIVTIEPGVNATGLPLHTYTPNVQHLTIKSADLPSIAHNFPDLVSFHLETGRDLDQAMLFEFFSLNRHLREVYTTIIRSKSYLKHINEMLSNLETLTLENELGIDDITNEPIHFPNVQHYALTFPYVPLSNIYDIYSSIQFEQLQSFNLSVRFDMPGAQYTPQYMQLATAYKTINSLKVSVVEFGHLRLSALTQFLPALKTLDLAWQVQLPNTGFNQFLSTVKTLDTVIFSLQYPATEYWSLDKFESQLPAQWTVSNVEEIYKFLEEPSTEVTLVRAQ